MKYYLYVDESGPFVNKSASFVGGFLTEKSPEELYEQVQKTIEDFRKKYPDIELGIEDIHAAELLHPDNYFKKDKKEKYESIDLDTRKEFIDSFFKIIEKNTCYYFVITDTNLKSFEIDKKTAQHRYGECLISIILLIAKNINISDKDSLDFCISARSKKVIPKDEEWEDYHNKLGGYIKEVLKKSGIESSEHIKHKKGQKIEAPLKLADIVCYYYRNENNFRENNKLKKQNKDEAAINTYKDFKEKYLNELLANEEFAAAYRLDRDKEHIGKIISIKEKEKQKSQFTYFIEIAKEIIEQRNNLDEAYEILEKIEETVKNNSKLIEINKKTLNEMMKVFNHKGEIDKIQNLVEKFKQLLNQETENPFLGKLTELIEFENRALNNLLNSYRFDKVIDKFETKLEEYEKIIAFAKKRTNLIEQDDKCYLLHKCFSSIGQGYAFLSSAFLYSTDKDYFKLAEKFFERSMKQWNGKDTRTANYMIIFYWYHKQTEKSIETLKKYRNDIYKNDSLVDSIKELKESKLFLFDFLILLRLIYEQEQLEHKLLLDIKKIAKDKITEYYPSNMIYKWIGLCLLKRENYSEAKDYFEKSIEIKRGGFTVESLSLPTEALKIICEQKIKPKGKYDYNDFEQVQKNLSDKSKAFKEYIESQNLIEDIQQQNIEKITRWLPFYYS